MPQLRQGDRPYFVTLGDDQALTVTPDAGSSAIVRTYPRLLGGESTSQVVLGAGQSQRFLATPSSSRFAIEVTAGSVQYVQSLFEDAGWDGTKFTDPVKALVSGGGNRSSANTVVLFGDSITNNNNANNGASQQVGNVTYQYQLQDVGYFTWANILLNGAFTVLRNSGIAGDTTGPGAGSLGNMLSRIDADVIAYKPRYCVVMAGINDLNLGFSAASITANLETIYTKLRQAGITVIACTVLPNNTINALGAGHAKVEAFAQVNAWIRRYGATTDGIIAVDTFSALYDPATICGAVAGSFVDSTHPGTVGANKVGVYLAAALQGVVKASPAVASLGDLASATNPFGNLIGFPVMTGAAGTKPSGNTAPPGTLSSVAITGTAGQFSCSAAALAVGQSVVISGTLGGTGSITGYANPTTYYITVTNGSTTFTLSATPGGAAITTTAGTPTGLTYTFGGTFPTGWWLQDVSSTAGGSSYSTAFIPRTDKPGKFWHQTTLSWTATQATVATWMHRLLTATALPVGVSAGDTIDIAWEANYLTPVNAGGVEVFLDARDSGNATLASAQFVYSQGPTTPEPAFSGVIRIRDFVLPAGTVSLIPKFVVRNLAGTVGGCTVQLGDIEVRKRS